MYYKSSTWLYDIRNTYILFFYSRSISRLRTRVVKYLNTYWPLYYSAALYNRRKTTMLVFFFITACFPSSERSTKSSGGGNSRKKSGNLLTAKVDREESRSLQHFFRPTFPIFVISSNYSKSLIFWKLH